MDMSEILNFTPGTSSLNGLTAYGESIRESVDPDAAYYVVTDSYSSGYAKNNMTVIDTYSPDTFARDLLADYVNQGGLG